MPVQAKGAGKGWNVMDVFDAVRTVLAVREYQDKPVPHETVRKIVEAGRLTASSQNKQPWHFIVVEERDTLRKLGELAKSGPYTAQASFAIVLAIESESRFAVSDVSRAAQSMMLTAWEEGVGSNWAGFGGLGGVKDALGVPAGIDVLAVLPFGYPARNVGRGKKVRRSLSEVASSERYGRPFG
jgi:nitroreductase